MKVAEPPEDLTNLFKKYAEDSVMTLGGLQKFLIEIQGEKNATIKDAQEILESVVHLNIFHRMESHLEAFFQYLLSDINSPLFSPSKVHHDMNAPLAHYFLYAGHNSYLTGNQISSASSVKPIVRALHQGVRVIELDLWPNFKGDDIQVRHGWTLTKPVKLIKCLRAIKDNAFSASEYPVVITFEDHLTPNLQDKVAKMVERTFKDMLASEKLESPDFPSPESLKRKILISTKLPKTHLETQGIKEESKRKEIETAEKDLRVNKNERNESNDTQQLEEDEKTTIPEYRHLISIRAVKRKAALENLPSMVHGKATRLSLSEQKFEEFIEKYGIDILRFTQRNLLRIYPRVTRIFSTNYNPLIGWMYGAQMVAFNMQGHGKYLWIMQGVFRANGGCGYVKKPNFLLDDAEVFDPKAIRTVKTNLKVKLFMGIGWDLDFRHKKFGYYSLPNFFTKVGIAGVPADSVMKKTKALEGQWIPLWNQEFEFSLTVPEMALLRIEVYNSNISKSQDFAGQTCLPVWELRSGIRSIPLHDRKGEMYRSIRLLMRFDFVK